MSDYLQREAEHREEVFEENDKLRELTTQLKEEIETLKSEFTQCSDALNSFERYSEFLESKLETLIDDALKYRWMRDIGQDKLEVFIFNEHNNCPEHFATWHAFDDMDSAIQNAMTQYPLKPREQ